MSPKRQRRKSPLRSDQSSTVVQNPCYNFIRMIDDTKLEMRAKFLNEGTGTWQMGSKDI